MFSIIAHGYETRKIELELLNIGLQKIDGK
jgi:hypothetical protein